MTKYICVYLLYPQTEVEDAVWAVGLSIGPSHFSDEARQSKAQLSRVTLKDVFFNIHYVGYRGRDHKKKKKIGYNRRRDILK